MNWWWAVAAALMLLQAAGLMLAEAHNVDQQHRDEEKNR